MEGEASISKAAWKAEITRNRRGKRPATEGKVAFPGGSEGVTDPLNPQSDLGEIGRKSPAAAAFGSETSRSSNASPPLGAARAREESPPTVRAGDRAQVRSGRPLALEQKRHVSARPMRAREPDREGGELTRRGRTAEERWNGETSPVQVRATR